MFFCEICRKNFEPKPGELDFLEQLFGIRGAECPTCGSFWPFFQEKPAEQKLRPH